MTAKTVALLFLFTLVPIVANAQFFSTGSLAVDGSNVQNVGTTFEAINIYSGDVADPNITLNGVTFTGVTGGSDLSGSNFTLSNIGIDAGRAGIVSPSDAIYPLVADGAYNTNGNRSMTLTLTGLSAGTYSIQFFFSTDDSSTRSASVTDGLVTSDIVNGTNTSGPVFITDTFTTTGGSHAVVVNNETNGGGTNGYALQFSGFTVQTVPEPSTYALMLGGLVLLGFCLRRKAALLS